MAHQIAIFGDSHVEKLRNFCNGNLKVPGQVHWYGHEDLRLDRMGHELHDSLLSRPTTVAVIILGGNDVTPTSTPREIFQRICSLADDLYAVGTQHVYVSEVMTRGKFSKCPGLSKDSFDRQRRKLNKLLAKTFQHYLLRFPDVKFPKDYSSDGVHLDGRGLKKFECRLRRVLCALKY